MEKAKLYKIPENYPFNCHCGRNFSLEKSFNSHRKKFHREILPVTSIIKDKCCPICTFKSISQTEMGEHFKIEHNMDIKKEALIFASKDEFLLWKQEEETKTSSKFIQIRGSQQHKSFTVFSYKCHRSGYYTPKGKGIRRLKTQGSEKINAFCPACINIKISNDGVCRVVYTSTHIGHDPHSFLRRKEELMKQYMDAIVLPEQLTYMESNFLIVSPTLSAMQEAHDTKTSQRSKQLDDENGLIEEIALVQNCLTEQVDVTLYHDYIVCSTDS